MFPVVVQRPLNSSKAHSGVAGPVGGAGAWRPTCPQTVRWVDLWDDCIFTIYLPSPLEFPLWNGGTHIPLKP